MAQGKKLRLPAAYSAASTHVVEKEGYLDIFYSGKLGHPLLKSSQNPDAILSTVIAPHAVLLAAGVAPLSLASSLKEMEEHISGVYYPNFGWVDSLTVFEGSAIPNSVGVGVDKAMELIALLKILDPQGLSPSAKAFYKNAEVRRKLAHAYAAIFPDRFTRK